MEFLEKRFNTLQSQEEMGLQGRAIIQFIVDKEGNIVKPKSFTWRRSLSG